MGDRELEPAIEAPLKIPLDGLTIDRSITGLRLYDECLGKLFSLLKVLQLSPLCQESWHP